MMQLVEEIGVKNIEVYDDSKLIVNQVRGEYEVRHEDLVPYHNITINMEEKFRRFYVDHVPRQKNVHADALTFLAASLALPVGATEKVLIYNHDLYCPKFASEESQTPRRNLQVEEVLKTSTSLKLSNWRFSFIDFV